MMEKKEYYITNPKTGISVYYSTDIGRRRLYRQSNPKNWKGLRLLTFKSIKGAQSALDSTNEVSGGGFILKIKPNPDTTNNQPKSK